MPRVGVPSLAMSTLVMILGFATALIGVITVIAPDWLLSLVDLRTRTMAWAASIGRLALGAIFWIAAPETSAPFAFQIFGGILVGAGFLFLFLPFSAWQSLIDWITGLPTGFYRISGVFSTLFGLLIAYAA